MARTHIRVAQQGLVHACRATALALIGATFTPTTSVAHTSELSSWLTLQRDASGWVGMLEIRVPEKLLLLGLNLADLTGDRKVSEAELAALAKRWSRSVLTSVEILLEGEVQALAIDRVLWRTEGRKIIDVQTKLLFKSVPPSRGREQLQLRFFGKVGSVTLAVQSQHPWLLVASPSVEIGDDRRGFRKPRPLIEGKKLRVDLARQTRD